MQAVYAGAEALKGLEARLLRVSTAQPTGTGSSVASRRAFGSGPTSLRCVRPARVCDAFCGASFLRA